MVPVLRPTQKGEWTMKFNLEPGESMNIVAQGREYVITAIGLYPPSNKGAETGLRVRSEAWVGGYHGYRPILADSNEQGTAIIFEDMSVDPFSPRQR